MLKVYDKLFLCSLFIAVLLLFHTPKLYSQSYVRTKIEFIEGGTLSSRFAIGKTLTTVMQEVNRVTARQESNLERIKIFFTKYGFEEFNQLYKNTGFYSTIAQFKLNLLERPNGDFIVRGIKVWILNRSSKTNRSEYLVFTINPKGLISDVRFSLEQYTYEKLIHYGSDTLDMAQRQSIIFFLEEYRTAYNKKDIEFIKNVFSDDAIIIVGDTTANDKKELEIKPSSSLDWKKTLAYSHKSEYVEKLKYIFERNSYISVKFYDIKIVRHPRYPNVYGVNVEQRWNSSHYSDVGYIFLLFEFDNDVTPIIRIRSWQTDKFEDGTVIGLGDFKIIN